MFSAINRKIKRMVLRHQKAKPIVRISDTTLRDGAQTPGISLTAAERIRIANALTRAGVHSIDCGFASANQAEFDAMCEIARNVKGPILSGHARTKREDIDRTAEALSFTSPFKRAIQLFIGTSPSHREHKHGMTKAQVIDTVVKAIEYAGTHFEVISFGPEDASRTEPEFLHEVYSKAIDAGAISVGFADTVGILTPTKAADAIKGILDRVPNMNDAMLGVHFHNDLGLATANSLACVQAGANIVQGTINGIGERAGNTAIEEVVMTMSLHPDEFKLDHGIDIRQLSALSQLVADLTKFAPAPNKAVVGRNIFRTEAGVHQDGLLKHQETYLPFEPERIGAGPVELVLGPSSGRKAVRHHLEAVGIQANEEIVTQVLDYLKNGQHQNGELAEIHGFLERLRPYMSVDQYVPDVSADANGAEGHGADVADRGTSHS